MAIPSSASIFFLLNVFISIQCSSQLDFSQTQTLLRIRQLLNYPSLFSNWTYSTDFCNTEFNPSVTIVCYEDSITQLLVNGNNNYNIVYPVPESSTVNSLFATIAGLPNLKVLSLISLGLWGPFPGAIGLLYSLEILNVSSNNFNGAIPVEVSSLKNLQTLVLDNNLFSGKFPGWVSSLPNLSVLSMKNNSLNGSLPSSLSSMRTLRILQLSMNYIYGEVPNLQNLTNLQVVDLQENYFGPNFPTLPTHVVDVAFRKNKFGLGLPASLMKSYYQLEKLDISMNDFVGPFPPFLLSLPSITYLDISGNRFTGLLFQNMSCNDQLNFVNLSSNLLTGKLPNCLRSSSKNRAVVSANNCLENGDSQQFPTSFCRIEALAVNIPSHKQHNSKGRGGRAVLALSTLGAVGGGIIVFALILFVSRKIYMKKYDRIPSKRFIKENVTTIQTAKQLSDASYIIQTMKLGALSIPAYRTFALEELKEATNNFDVSTLMGEGPHGEVYKGKLADGAVVAIRCLKMKKRQNALTFTHHIELISKLRNSQLVNALGHCFESYPDDSTICSIFIIFEFITDGTLRDAITDQRLNWVQRMTAAIDITKGIQFLHTGMVPGIFTNNLKITNVLMDQNLHAKISSYNLPLFAEYSRMVAGGTSLMGSKRSIRGSFSSTQEGKTDIYDLGAVLLEIVTGRPIMSQKDTYVVKDIVQVRITADHRERKSIADAAIRDECSNESLKTLMELCLKCLSSEPDDRPSVEDVLWNLQFAAQAQQGDDNAQLKEFLPTISILSL